MMDNNPSTAFNISEVSAPLTFPILFHAFTASSIPTFFGYFDQNVLKEIEDEDEDEGVVFCLTSVVGFWLSKLFLISKGFPPFFPAFVRIFLIFSSRIILRQIKIPEPFSIDATPYSRILVKVVVRICLSKPRAWARASSGIFFPFRRSLPRSSDSCMSKRISNQTPRSKYPSA